MRSSASFFNLLYHVLSLRSSSSCLSFLPHLPITTILASTFPSITCFKRQFLRNMWPIQLAFLLFLLHVGYYSPPWLHVILLHFIGPACKIAVQGSNVNPRACTLILNTMCVCACLPMALIPSNIQTKWWLFTKHFLKATASQAACHRTYVSPAVNNSKVQTVQISETPAIVLWLCYWASKIM
jgi:hypothetical protein